MGQEPEAIRQQIAETRAEMGETVEAIGYKADVKSRAKENVQGKVDSVTGRVTAAKEKVVGRASDMADQAPSGGDLKDGAAAKAADAKDMAQQNVRQAASIAQENPLGLAIGAVAIGFLGGMMIRSTRFENEHMGPMADQIKDQVREAGGEAIEHGKAVASDAMHAAQDAAKDAAESIKDSGQQHADDLKSSVRSTPETASAHAG